MAIHMYVYKHIPTVWWLSVVQVTLVHRRGELRASYTLVCQ